MFLNPRFPESLQRLNLFMNYFEAEKKMLPLTVRQYFYHLYCE